MGIIYLFRAPRAAAHSWRADRHRRIVLGESESSDSVREWDAPPRNTAQYPNFAGRLQPATPTSRVTSSPLTCLYLRSSTNRERLQVKRKLGRHRSVENPGVLRKGVRRAGVYYSVFLKFDFETHENS